MQSKKCHRMELLGFNKKELDIAASSFFIEKPIKTK